MIGFQGISLDLTRRQKQLSRAQDAIDKKVIELLEDYTPVAMKGGFTKASPRKWVYFRNKGKMSKAHRQEKPGVIINPEPKARREYYTNKGFSGPNRGKLWLDRMKADKIGEVHKAAAEELK